MKKLRLAAALPLALCLSALAPVGMPSAHALSVVQEVNGRTVDIVRFAGGSFEEQGGGNWVEKRADGSVAFRFREQARDDWSVYLHDASRNVYLQLDLHRRMVLYNAGSEPRRDLYPITDASAGRTAAVAPTPAQPRPQVQPPKVLKLTANALNVTQMELLPNAVKLTGPNTQFTFSDVTDRRPADGNLTASVGLGVIGGQPDIGQSFSLGARNPVVNARFASGRTLSARVIPNLPHPQGTPSQVTGPIGKPLGPFSLKNLSTQGFLQHRGGALTEVPDTRVRGARWLIEPIGQQRPPRFVRLATIDGRHLKMAGGAASVSPASPGDSSAHWVMRKDGNFCTFESATRPGAFLNVTPGGAPLAGPMNPTYANAKWVLANAERGAGGRPPAGTGAQAQGSAPVTMIFQNYSPAPLDIFIQEASGQVGFVETLAPMKAIRLPSKPGTAWRLSQGDRWVGSAVSGAGPSQTVPFGR